MIANAEKESWGENGTNNVYENGQPIIASRCCGVLSFDWKLVAPNTCIHGLFPLITP